MKEKLENAPSIFFIGLNALQDGKMNQKCATSTIGPVAQILQREIIIVKRVEYYF